MLFRPSLSFADNPRGSHDDIKVKCTYNCYTFDAKTMDPKGISANTNTSYQPIVPIPSH